MKRSFFTKREIQVLRLIAEGLQSKNVAERLEISKRTVDFHLAGIYSKTGASNRIQAMLHPEAVAVLRVVRS